MSEEKNKALQCFVETISLQNGFAVKFFKCSGGNGFWFNLQVWFADNRVSIEHHENGQKHKAAIQAKLRELGKQSKAKEKAVLFRLLWEF